MTTTEIKDGKLVLLGANDGNAMDSIHASEIAAMARELLAHRRASQAAPAPQKPVAWAETDHKGKVIGVSMNQYPWHPTPLYAAPAPSDGLREENERLRGVLAGLKSKWLVGDIESKDFNHV